METQILFKYFLTMQDPSRTPDDGQWTCPKRRALQELLAQL